MDIDELIIERAIKSRDSFKKFDSGKPKMSYPIGMQHCLAAVSEVMKFGAKKYGRDNWRMASSEESERYLDAAIRHISAHCSGEFTDSDSGNMHIHHAVTSLMMYVEINEQHTHDANNSVEVDF